MKEEKTQIARRTVTYLGRLISANSMTLTDSQKESILNHGKPTIVKHMLAFLGLTGYSRNHIPDYVSLTQPLRDILNTPKHEHSTTTPNTPNPTPDGPEPEHVPSVSLKVSVHSGVLQDRKSTRLNSSH